MPITKKRVTSSTDVRSRKPKDTSPRWDNCEEWTTDQFYRYFRTSMDYYRLESSARDLKPFVISWMDQNGYPKESIKKFKNTKDWRCNTTVGSIAANLLRGMPAVRLDFNEGRNTSQWLGEQISKIIDEGYCDEISNESIEEKNSIPVVSIQERLKEAAARMTEEIDYALDSFSRDPESFEPKAFKVLNLLKGKQAKAAHARLIKDFYIRSHDEVIEASVGKDEQLKEGYSHLSKKQLKKLIDFYTEVVSACDMLMQEAKINKKPRAKKSVPAEKVVSKLKYLKSDEPSKLVSINPVDIIGAKELWVYNIKTRKLGKYVAEEYRELSIKGTSIIGFSESNSMQKTLRKPEEQLKEFKAAGKVQLRKFLEDIKAVDIKLNGRINEDTILLKVA